MKIVVTGPLGHIGSQLIREIPCIFPDALVVLLDDLSTKRYCSLFQLPATGNYRFFEADILKADLAGFFREADVVIHLAAITDAAGSFELKDHVERTNFEGTERVARACVQTGSRLIFISTTSIYGTQSEVVDEDCPVTDLKPQSPYAESKLKAERLLEALGQQHGLQFITCRFGTIFGVSPGMRFHTAVNKFCWQAVMGNPITVWRTALHQLRPYLDLTDAVAALGFIIKTNLFDGRIYNVVTANSSVKSIVDIIAKQVPDLVIEYVDSQIMNQLSYTVANERFKGMGFEFKGSLEEGITSTIQLIKGVRRW